MKTISYKSKNYRTALAGLQRRGEPASEIAASVARILAAVRKDRDRALLRLTRKYDGARLQPGSLRVADVEWDAACREVAPSAVPLVAAALKNVSAFAKRSLRKDWKMKNAQGAEVGEVYRPFERVGVYVPGGTAPLVSTAVMTVGLAKAAGVPEIAVCTPCGADGSLNAALLYALREAGATEIYRVGGAQAIAALAYGTETSPPVAKIFGPGNAYVVEAKRQVFGVVSIDLLPGPSEIFVVADDSGRPDWIAADLLAQAEHGGDSLVVFATDSKPLLEDVKRQLNLQAKNLSRQKPLRNVLRDGCTLILAASIEEAVALANGFAPEHLTLISREEEKWLPLIRTAGAIFLGNHSPVAAGDFLAGPSHTLPTGGAGKAFAGLTVDQFQRRTSIVKLDPAAMQKSAPIIDGFSKLEGLDAHGRSATIRLEPDAPGCH